MKKPFQKEKRFHIYINSLFLLLLLFFLLGGGICLLLYTAEKSSLDSPAVRYACWVLCALYALFFFLYIKCIYLPVHHLNRAIRQIMDGNFDSLLPESGITELSAGNQEFNEFITSIRQIINNEYHVNLLKKHAELNALQSQINPHFLYNTIDSIRGQALQDGSYAIADTAKALASIFRYCINTQENLVTLREELQHISNYFSIQQYRFHNRFTMTIDIEEHVPDLRLCRLPRLTLQPLVENAIGHGLECKPGPGSIQIKVRASQSRLIITVEDDGLGIESSYLAHINEVLLESGRTLLKSSSPKQGGNRFALLNVNERIRILWGENYGVRIYSTYGVGTQCEVVLPLLTESSKPVS